MLLKKTKKTERERGFSITNKAKLPPQVLEEDCLVRIFTNLEITQWSAHSNSYVQWNFLN
jgi:hypothetical protein